MTIRERGEAIAAKCGNADDRVAIAKEARKQIRESRNALLEKVNEEVDGHKHGQ